ncbi:hypothetical protein V6Z11_A03G099200 [Gossypium hirsutum]
MPDSNKNQALANIKERFALEVSDDYIKKALGKKWRDNKSTLKKQYFKKDISLEEKLRNEKLKEKKAKYEAIASTDSSVNLENIDNRIITEVLGPERYGRVRFQGSGVTPTQYFGSGSQQYMPSGSQAQAEVQRLRDQMAQMQANTVEQIAEVQQKYKELQQQLRAEAAKREAAAAAREAAAAVREAEVRPREAEATAMAAEQSKKYNDLQLQLQQMMQMLQQSQKPPS